MTVRELCDALLEYAKDPETADKEIEIPVVGGIGYSDAIGVAGVMPGFDWDTGRIFLYSKRPIRKV